MDVINVLDLDRGRTICDELSINILGGLSVVLVDSGRLSNGADHL